ncbi:MAG: hypothetical protein JWL84_713 [Rhodospirillales bacterium]|jgi:hypothetical protein|nr:hypothetical protein [Rhodospirillales bacterium]
MTSLRIAAISAALLLAAGSAVPARAASGTSLTSKSLWSTMDKCTKTARELYPDDTADGLAKRDAYVRTCQRDSRVPIREGQAPKQ